MYGRVTRTFPDKGYGFILGENRQSYFIHYSNLNGEYIDPGYYIFFKPFQNDRSDYNAKNIVVIDAIERKRKYGNTCKKHE
ncbi:MAG: cold shock domain-containing protein [Lachnospiraceae bacterium]|nr:cold shock domain-containing protein [Lachnospiraceae bacterium]